MKNIKNERKIVKHILQAMNSLSLHLPIYDYLIKLVNKGLYIQSLEYIKIQRELKNIRKDDYIVLLFVLKSADAFWVDNYEILSK